MKTFITIFLLTISSLLYSQADLIIDSCEASESLRVYNFTISEQDWPFICQEGQYKLGYNHTLAVTTTIPNMGPEDAYFYGIVQHPEYYKFDSCHQHIHLKDFLFLKVFDCGGKEVTNGQSNDQHNNCRKYGGLRRVISWEVFYWCVFHKFL